MGENHKVVERWRSERLERELTVVRWGAVGQPVLLFPTAGGDAEEAERFLMLDALAPLLAEGRIKVYSCDNAAGRSLLEHEGSARHRMWLQNQFHYAMRHEVVPAIRLDCLSPEVEVWTAGASIGAFHAVAMVCRWPDVFSRAIAMSGTYDLRRFFHADHEGFSDEFWVSSPLHFLPNLGGLHLDVLRTRFILLPSGEGENEDLGETWAMANALGRQGVPNRVDPWGPEWHHDWPTWRAMLPRYLAEWTTTAG
jgi:esterase/lipase superfamily enzyme